MKKTPKKLSKAGKSRARKAYENIETKVMAAVGRTAVRSKVRAAKTVGKKAAKAAVTAGAMAAAGVLLREIRKRKRN
jgi:hypothetical protein